jgi:hypothetical protein
MPITGMDAHASEGTAECCSFFCPLLRISADHFREQKGDRECWGSYENIRSASSLVDHSGRSVPFDVD